MHRIALVFPPGIGILGRDCGGLLHAANSDMYTAAIRDAIGDRSNEKGPDAEDDEARTSADLPASKDLTSDPDAAARVEL